MKCYICRHDKETRPYGPNGEDLCHPCMKADPERERIAKEQFFRAMSGCGPVAVLTPDGPKPLGTIAPEPSGVN